MDGSLARRTIGAARLEAAAFAEVQADTGATQQAAAVVTAAAVSAAAGAVTAGPLVMAAAMAAVILQWLLWTAITLLVGRGLLGGSGGREGVLRALGFAHAPGILHALGALPAVGGTAELLVWAWILAAGVIATREALGLGTGRAVGLALLGGLASGLLGLFVREGARLGAWLM